MHSQIIFTNYKSECIEQNSNLRRQSPLDFESNALTTQPSVLTRLEVDIVLLNDMSSIFRHFLMEIKYKTRVKDLQFIKLRQIQPGYMFYQPICDYSKVEKVILKSFMII